MLSGEGLSPFEVQVLDAGAWRLGALRSGIVVRAPVCA